MVHGLFGDYYIWVPETGAGPIYTSTNSGITWIAATNAPIAVWDSVGSSMDGTKLAATAANSIPIYTSADSGVTWTPASSPATNWSSVASSADGNKLVAAVQGGQIYTWNITNLFIITQPTSQTVPVGINVTLNISVSGASPLFYQWQENGTNLIGATNAMLTLTNLALSASGSYAVLVTNQFNGVLSSNAVVTVLPALVTTLPTTGTSFNQATFNGTITPGPNQTVVSFQWGTDTNYGNVTPALTVGNGLTPMNFSNAVMGLTPGTVYHCQAVASNVFGVAVGADFAFNTRTNPPALAFTINVPSSPAPVLSEIAVDGAANIYVADLANEQVMKFSINGTYQGEWFSGSGYALGMGVAVDNLNKVYVSDVYGEIVRKYNSLGMYLFSLGSSGSGNGQFQGPDYIAAGNNVYVSDSGNFRIQEFSAAGSYLTQWGSQGTNNAQFGYGVAGVALDGSNNLYVADPGNWRIQKFSSTGAYLTQWGNYGDGPGQFYYPESVAADASNNIYVLDYDYSSTRIEKFAGDGSFLTQLILPSNGNYTGMAVDRRGNFIFVTDNFNNRILVFVNDLSIVAPLIISQPVSRTVTMGASVTFSASVFGGNPLAYQWQAHGTNLPGATNTSITLAAVGPGDAGAYRLVVTNSAGQSSSSSAQLTIAAAFTTTQPANAISATNATLNGMATASETNTAAWFQWGLSTAYGNVAALTNIPPSGNVTPVAATINGLTGIPTYHFRLVVSNAFGVVYGADQQFTTGRKIFLTYPDPNTA
ncbi:MAG TPA: 6-bladed beta-propeller, partial [Candidatus Acidoferrum sp.]|nr:6-bladed beta-propeller [Candidatus Acidoferrum sp.]